MIDYLVIGHLTCDLLPDGSSAAGGTALYAAVTAARLGLRAGILSAARPADLPALPDRISLALSPSPSTSRFENRYGPTGRSQWLHAVGAPISLADLPTSWHAAPIVHLGPVLHECALDLVAAFPNALVGVTPQGWMRDWAALTPAPVRRIPWRPDPRLLRQIDALVLSIEDLDGDEALALDYARHCSLLALTRGAAGAILFVAGKPHIIAPFPAVERDPTGAGDVFAAALLVGLRELGDPREAAAFAAAVAACAVEGPGISAIPTRATALARMQSDTR